jgi:predicted ATPase
MEWRAMGLVCRGSALLQLECSDRAVAQVLEGISARVATGALNGTTYWLVFAADAYLKAGNLDLAAAMIEEAAEFGASHGEGTLDAEIHRLRGELLLRQPRADIANAAAEFDTAIAIGRARGAKSLELRAAISLARLWNQEGRGEQARPILAEVCGSFSAGLDTADLRAARALLDQIPSCAAKTLHV